MPTFGEVDLALDLEFATQAESCGARRPDVDCRVLAAVTAPQLAAGGIERSRWRGSKTMSWTIFGHHLLAVTGMRFSPSTLNELSPFISAPSTDRPAGWSLLRTHSPFVILPTL